MSSSNAIKPSTNTQTTNSSKSEAILPTFLFGLGILGTVGSFIWQFFAVKNGSSGQVTIVNNIQLILASVLTFILIILVGCFLFMKTSQSSTQYLWIFLFAMASYLISNMALIFSLFQVKVVKS